MQIRDPEEKPPLPHLAEVAVVHRFSWWPRRCRRRSLGEALCPLPPLGFRACPPAARGRRWPTIVDLLLIRRSASLRTGLVAAPADRRAPPSRPVDRVLPRRCGRSGLRPSGLAQIRSGLGPLNFFYKLIIIFLDLFNLLLGLIPK
jgi:hypothetical protein